MIVFCLVVWIRDMNRFKVVSYEVKNLKVKVPYRFMIIADLHGKSYGKKNQKLIEAITKWDPDGIIIAGDLVTGSTRYNDREAISLINILEKHYPIYYGHGNHENRILKNRKVFGKQYQKYRKAINGKNLHMLVNKGIYIPAFQVDIKGLEIGKEYFSRMKTTKMPESYIESLIHRSEKDSFQILIAHNPEYFERYQQWGADLTLSGHIHGGVIKIPFLGGVISPSGQLFPKYDGGIYEKNGKHMIISRGLGTHTLPVRIFNPGELVAVTLLPEKE